MKLKDLLLEKKEVISVEKSQTMRKAGYWTLLTRNLKKVIAVDKDEKKEEMLKDFMKDINFNKKFNELFEMNKLGNEEIDEGYGDWLKSDEDINNFDVKNRRDMAEVFNKKKKEMRLSIRDGGINDMENQVI